MTNSIQSPITEVKLSLNKLISADGRELTDAKEYLAMFRILPLFLLNSYGVKVEPTEGELYKLINNHLLTFIGILRWFDYFTSGKESDLENDYPELCLGHFKYVQSKAELSWATLNLCQEILKKDLWGWKKMRYFISPTKLWFSYEYEELENTFLQNGIIGKFVRVGKRRVCDSNRNQIQEDLDGFDLEEFFPPTNANCSQATHSVTSTSLNINNHAKAIAQQDREFSLLYRKYCKDKKRFYRDFRSHKELQLAGIKNDGSIYMTGKGKRGKDTKKRQKKGFG